MGWLSMLGGASGGGGFLSGQNADYGFFDDEGGGSATQLIGDWSNPWEINIGTPAAAVTVNLLAVGALVLLTAYLVRK